MHVLFFFRGLMYSSYNLLLSKTSFSQYHNNVLVSEEPDSYPVITLVFLQLLKAFNERQKV